MQRLRIALPYFAENGWEVTVATADPSCYEAPQDELLGKTIPTDTRILRLPCWDEGKCRRFGFGHLSNRIVWPWRHAVRRILQNERFNLVFFTTTQAMVMANASYWRRKTGVPYVIDLQDPIYVPGGSYTRRNSPGVYWKYRVSLFFSRFLERAAFACPSAVVATSAYYLDVLRSRYPWLKNVPMETLPFGFPEKDFELVDELVPRHDIFTRHGEEKMFFYAGRGGPDLHPALNALFEAAKRLVAAQPELAASLRFLFLGSSYAPVGRGTKQVEPLARAKGCGAFVTDEPERRPYFEVLKATKDADCVLVLGSKSADYTASKALGALTAGKRVLAVVHRDSLVHQLYSGNPKVLLCAFDETPEEEACVEAIMRSIRTIAQDKEPVPRDKAVPGENTARAMTRKLCRMFDLAAGTKSAA